MSITYVVEEHETVAHLVQIRAKEDGKQIGLLGMYTNKAPGELTIVSVSVNPARQGRGIAKAMHALALEAAKSRGLKLRGAADRNPAYKTVWAKLQARREAFEAGQ